LGLLNQKSTACNIVFGMIVILIEVRTLFEILDIIHPLKVLFKILVANSYYMK